MSAKILVPSLGESVTEATIAKWFKSAGESVNADEILVELETDKVTLEVNAPASGVLSQINVKEGETVSVGTLLGLIEEGEVKVANSNAKAQKPAAPAFAPAPVAVSVSLPADNNPPAVRKLAAEQGINPASIPGSGKDGRVTKGDVLKAIDGGSVAHISAAVTSGPREERVKMTRLRKRIAERLKESQNTAAILTTFNEIDMTNVMALRNQYKDAFEKKHGVKLGFMSFFVKAAVNALKEIPAVNAEIDGDDLVYKNHYDIGVAVGTEQGLVVPVVRNADHLSFAGVEKTINDYGKKARDGKLTMEDMTGGTFTVSNGGVYGSLMSTPIINPPQSGILGMHKTQMRPVVVEGNKIEARPMMYIALSYDHRIIDGKEAVTFLVRVKECIEDPQRLLLDM
ncbi:MAG: dihydrolipoyllysine-residue succinyltransferase [Rickettsiales bacterium]|jgi:2-oxoglutarate dehydrogenase E2 component (dihydrolipoamide succinyltransferase)|nr:dihydrolipoyllysine-residue succinyltransferase [Rickettsiales bacterium]